MTGGDVDVRALGDKIAIGELLARYARAVDSKDWELWRSVFTADARVDYGASTVGAGPRDEMADRLARALDTVPMTQHFVTNVEVDLDGDRAKARALFYSPMQLPGIEGLSFCGGCYHHDLVRTSEGWRSEHLVEENLWFVNPPKRPDEQE